MNSSNDLIIGQATHYDWPRLEPYARSLWMSGYRGKKVLFIKGLTAEAVDNLAALGFELIQIPDHPPQTKDFFQGAGRFLQSWRFIINNKPCPYRYVLFADVGDLIFQRDPSEDMDEILCFEAGASLLAAPEYIRHTNEAWNASGIKNCFPEVENWIADKMVYCSGAIAGRAEVLADLLLNVYLTSKFLAAKVHGIDQPAFNTLIHQESYQEITFTPDMSDAWVLNSQVMAAPSLIDTYRPWLMDKEPEMRNGLVYPQGSETPFCIVHQYNRNPEWIETFRKRYCADPKL